MALLSPAAAELWPPSLLRTHSQRMGGSARSLEFKYGLSLYKRKGIVNQTGAREALARAAG
jgi:hypothetical protein